jgi:hypothetical protein
MPIYYLIVNKERIASKEGNLPSSYFGERDAASLPFLDRKYFDGNAKNRACKLWFDLRKPTPEEVRSNEILIKVNIDDKAMNETTYQKHEHVTSTVIIANYHDPTKAKYREVGLKVTVLSQVMPDGSERYKHNAEQEERPAIKAKKDHSIIRLATAVAQLGIDVKEKIENKKAPEPPKAGKHV